MKIIKRSGSESQFDLDKIISAVIRDEQRADRSYRSQYAYDL